jgi:molybdopterin converting factor small subunit
VPLRHRACEADRADLEARVLRGRRCLDRRRDRGSRRRPGREVEPGGTIGAVWRDLAGEFPALADYERSISAALNADYARMDAEVHDGDEVAFLPPVSGG